MKKIILSVVTCLTIGAFTAANAQSLERQVVASSGEYLTNPNINLTLSCTVGEPVVATLTNVKLILTQGFQQPLENDVLGTGINYTTADWNIKAYPNPFTDVVNIEISSDVASEFGISITNLLGQNFGGQYLANHYPGKNVYQINTSTLAQGLYVVTVASKDGKLNKSFKLTNIR
jgi:hypothetical protein